MKTKLNLNKFALGSIISALLLTACSVASAAPLNSTPTTDDQITVIGPNIVAESRIVPRESVDLAFVTNGEVFEVFVEEGDQVEAGDVLARLGNQESLLSAIANAELDLFNAQQALEKLHEDVEITRAKALKSIAGANRGVRDAQYQLDNFTIPSNQLDFTAIEAVSVMQDELDRAREDFEPYKNKASGNDTREELKEVLDNAQSDYNAAVRRLEYEIELAEAKTRLDKAMQDHEALQDGPNADDLAAADVRIVAAQAALEAAKAALDDLELKATIDGTVVQINLIVGEQVSPGLPVIALADFSEWYVETEDLNEIDVVDVNIGQPVSITPDALPDTVLTGTVTSISELFEEKRGDVTYTVKILVDGTDPRLRWGMTVAVAFE